MKIYTGCDHAGFALRNKLVDRMRNQGHEVVDFGTNSEAACDYPEYAALVASAVRSDVGSVGVLVCATGHGTAIAAGKVRGIRAFAPSSVEAARLSRFDNNTNVLCLGGRILAESDAFEIVDTWLSTGFAGGRHGRRIAKIAAMETAAALNFLVEGEYLRLAAKGIPASIWAKDAAAFAPTAIAVQGSSDNLGWLNAPSDMEGELPSITAFADQVRKAGFRRAVLLGMGGSALPAEVLARMFGPAAGWLNVFVLDCTDPAAVAAVETSIDLERTLFVVASKSGSTPEVCAFERYFWAKVLQRWAAMRARPASTSQPSPTPRPISPSGPRPTTTGACSATRPTSAAASPRSAVWSGSGGADGHGHRPASGARQGYGRSLPGARRRIPA